MHAPVSELWAAHEAGDDQWFWLHAGEGAAPTADQASGLLMFTWTPQTPFAQVRCWDPLEIPFVSFWYSQRILGWPQQNRDPSFAAIMAFP